MTDDGIWWHQGDGSKDQAKPGPQGRAFAFPGEWHVTVELHADAAAFLNLSRSISRLPGEIRAKAFRRAVGRIRSMAKTRLVRRSHEHTKVPVSIIRQRTSDRYVAAADALELSIRSDWIGLAKYGARQTKRGVTVRGRGSYAHAFIARMASGHMGVMVRTGRSRLPIRELYGANPAHAAINNPEDYLPMLAELIEDAMLPRVLHELSRLLPR